MCPCKTIEIQVIELGILNTFHIFCSCYVLKSNLYFVIKLQVQCIFCKSNTSFIFLEFWIPLHNTAPVGRNWQNTDTLSIKNIKYKLYLNILLYLSK